MQDSRPIQFVSFCVTSLLRKIVFYFEMFAAADKFVSCAITIPIRLQSSNQVGVGGQIWESWIWAIGYRVTIKMDRLNNRDLKCLNAKRASLTGLLSNCYQQHRGRSTHIQCSFDSCKAEYLNMKSKIFEKEITSPYRCLYSTCKIQCALILWRVISA